MNKSWDNYFDSNYLIVQSNKDGGDSCARTFAYHFLKNDTIRIIRTYLVLMNPEKPGLLRRSPHYGKWYSDWDRLSRDQLIPALCALGKLYDKKPLKEVFFRHLRRLLLFTWNTRKNFQYPTLEEHKLKSTPDVKWDYRWKVPDLCGPEIWGLYIRGFNLKWAGSFLYLADLETLINSILIRFRSNKTDVMNHLLILETTKNMPTLFSWMAGLITPKSLLKSRLDKFFEPEYEPPMNELVK